MPFVEFKVQRKVEEGHTRRDLRDFAHEVAAEISEREDVHKVTVIDLPSPSYQDGEESP